MISVIGLRWTVYGGLARLREGHAYTPHRAYTGGYGEVRVTTPALHKPHVSTKKTHNYAAITVSLLQRLEKMSVAAATKSDYVKLARWVSLVSRH